MSHKLSWLDLLELALAGLTFSWIYRRRAKNRLHEISDEEFLLRFGKRFSAPPDRVLRARRRVGRTLSVPGRKLSPEFTLQELTRRFELLGDFGMAWEELEWDVDSAAENRRAPVGASNRHLPHGWRSGSGFGSGQGGDATPGLRARRKPSPDPGAQQAEERAQWELLRDIFGPLPFRPVSLDPACLSWNLARVRGLAGLMYSARNFDRMSEVGDALASGGCMNAEILSHCSQGSAPVRGCWVIDLVLGKE